jgi:ATP-dependent DNA helicase DinG
MWTSIAALLGPGGPVARAHPGYEDRPTQRGPGTGHCGVYNDGGVALAEAGTGTGKSVAYLIPAIEWAVRNRERTVVSTNTINLQEQLVTKDLPFLRSALARPFRYALVKGRGNYVSIRRGCRLAMGGAETLLDAGPAGNWTPSWSGCTRRRTGRCRTWRSTPSPEVWDEVASESDVCLRARCPHFEQCFYQKARREAVSADILVVNHHLLFSDIAVRRLQRNYGGTAVLPPYRRVVLDEAHNLEDAATSHLGVRVTRRGLQRIARPAGAAQREGCAAVCRAAPVTAEAGPAPGRRAEAWCPEQLRPDNERARELASELFDRLVRLLDSTADGVLRLQEGFAAEPHWVEHVAPTLDDLLMVLDRLARDIGRVAASWHRPQAQRQPRRGTGGTGGPAEPHRHAAGALRTAFVPAQESGPLVRWIERRGTG